MSNVSDFFNSLATGAKWKAGVAFSRTGNLPLDDTSVKSSYEELVQYAATGATKFPGQPIAVVTETDATLYVTTPTPTGEKVTIGDIEYDVYVKKVGTIPVGDEKTITVAEDGTVSLKGVDSLVFEREQVAEDGTKTTVEVKYQALLTKTGLTWIEPSKITVEALNERLSTAETSISNIVNTTIPGLEADIDGLSSRVSANAEAISSHTGEINTLKTNVGTIDNLKTTKKDNLVLAINEVKDDVTKSTTASAISISTSPTTEGALKSYTITQGENTIGVIDIPKDMVVESGEVVKNPEGQAKGTYIKLILANVAEPLYINVGTLVDIYVAKAEAAQVQVAINSSTREISASIVAGSIGTTELADNSITTAKIADGNVTKDKLSTSVQESLNKADVAESNAKKYTDEQKSALETSISSTYETKTDATNKLTEAKQYTDEQKSTLETSVASTYETKTDASSKLTEAKQYTDEQKSALETSVSSTYETKIDATAKLTAAKKYTDDRLIELLTVTRVE